MLEKVDLEERLTELERDTLELQAELTRSNSKFELLQADNDRLSHAYKKAQIA